MEQVLGNVDGVNSEQNFDKPGFWKSELLSLYCCALAQHGLGKTELAEHHMRAAIKCYVRVVGQRGPFAIKQRLLLESWLREWGRDADADVLRAEINSFVVQEDENDQFGST